jgi:hypothetical protein
MTEPIGEPLDDATIDELADDNVMIDARTAKRLRSEAQRLRHRLREAEANRQAAEDARAGDLAKLANYEHRAVEQAVEGVLADPSDLWLHTTEEQQQAWVDQQFGEVIPDAARDAARALIESRPHLAKRTTPPPTDRPVESLRPGTSPEQTKPATPSWAAALRGH